MSFDFKSLREDKLKYTQEEMAELIGVDVEQIKEWDEGASSPSLQDIQAIIDHTDLDFNSILGYKKPTPVAFETNDSWGGEVATGKDSLTNYFNNALQDEGITKEYRNKYIFELKEGIEERMKKPTISIVGRSDTGKSTLINALLGAEKMPTSWTPTTSMAVYIKHVDDRPVFIKDDVWVFANHYGTEQMWDPNRYRDEQYCEKWKVANGGIGILKDFGTREGDFYSVKAGSAIVFVDAPILKNCDIIDLPGFGTETITDDTITMQVAQKADILIYLSQANGFMRIEDLNYLRQNIRKLPVWERKGGNSIKPLSNLFVVASQAHTVNNGNSTQLNKILKSGYENFLKVISSHYWDDRKKISGYDIDFGSKELYKRFFTYTTDIPSLCTRFYNELRYILEEIPNVIKKDSDQYIKEYIRNHSVILSNELNKYKGIKSEKEKYIKYLLEIDKSKLDYNKKNRESKNKIIKLMDGLSTSSKAEFSNFFSLTVNQNSIIAQMNDEGVSNTKKDVELFFSRLQDVILNECESILKRNGDVLAKAAQGYVSQYSNDIQSLQTLTEIEDEFDANIIFNSALSKINNIGGLGSYLDMENLKYGASLAASIGGGAALGFLGGALGIVGLTIAIACIAGFGTGMLINDMWRKNVAKKIVKTLDEQHVAEQYRNAIDKYWNDTKDAFSKATQELDKRWENHVSELRNKVNDTNMKDIDNHINDLQKIDMFYKHMPIAQ